MVQLSPTLLKFILHWGEMGSKWGINRTVAQIHALLYLSPEPLTAEDIATTLTVARSNVSNSLRELHGWGVIRVSHVMGDRRDYYSSMTDVWEMFQIIMDERKKRECDPVIEMLQDCVSDAKKAGKSEQHSYERLREMLTFFESMSAWYEGIRRLPDGSIKKLVKMGGKIGKLVGAR